MQRLSPGLQLSGGWRSTLQLVFLIADDVLLPLDEREDKVVSIETPNGHKLLIDLLLTDSPERRSLMPVEVQGTVLQEFVLRGGKTVLVLGRVLPFTNEDVAAIADMRSKLRVNYEGPMPDRRHRDAYVQAALTSFEEERGNIYLVIPVGLDSFVIKPPMGAQADRGP